MPEQCLVYCGQSIYLWVGRMMSNFEFVRDWNWQVFVVPAGVLVAAIVLHLAWSVVRKRAAASGARVSLIGRLNSPMRLLIWIAAIGIGIALAPDAFPGLSQARIATRLGVIVAGFWMVERLIVNVFNHRAEVGGLGVNLRILAITIFRAILVIIAAAMVLDTLGVAITPLLASLGVGSIAVALALQDTLGNLFSGLYLLADNPIRVGDFIRLEGGEDGYVEQIGWRSTRIRLLANNLVIVPNSKLAGARITNFSLPDPESAILVEMGVAYGSDLRLVEKVVTEAATATLASTEGGIRSFTPFIRLHTFADSSINFTVILRARQFTDGFLIKHEFIKNVHKAFAEHGIEIPFPQRVVHARAES